MLRIIGAAALSVTLVVGCGSPASPDREPLANTEPNQTRASSSSDPPVNEQEFHAKLLEIAAGYRSYVMVSPTAKWSPTYCRAPATVPIALSQSDDSGSHGKKLYFLFASDVFAYEQPKYRATAVNMALVKEAWHAKPVEDGDDVMSSHPAGAPVDAIVTDGDDKFAPGAQHDLFIMFKLGDGTPKTDKGWVYGTVTPDGKTVTSAGRVASCMSCHETAGPGRLFGMSQQEP